MKTSTFGTLFRVVGVVLVGALVLGMAACDNGTADGGGPQGTPDLPGTITISSDSISGGTPAEIDEALTADYSGDVTVSYQWKKDGINVGNDSDTYTPTEVGTYTVTISASGYNPKTSAPVDVIDPSLSSFTGDITITPNNGVTTGTELTADYDGDEEVTFSYQWKRDGANVGDDSPTYTPTQAGKYTVTISASGYNPKTSDSVTVTGGNINRPPEQLPVADRWGKWIDPSATAKLDYSVANDGVCTITVGGMAETPDWNKWKANAGYGYTANVNTPYAYTFQAWTQSGTRNLVVQYYVDNNDQVYKGSGVDITSTPETYTVKGERIPKGGVQTLEFQCADQLGTFYVKIISIEPYEPELEYELIADDWPNPNNGTYRVVSAIGMIGPVTIPATYNTLAVTEIGWSAFEGCSGITSIVIPEGVNSIEWGAFRWCTNLASISFPASVQSIQVASFVGSTKLTNITVAAGNQDYSSAGGILYDKNKTWLVAYPSAKGNITNIPTTVTYIEQAAFEACTGLTGVTIPSSVTEIGGWAFGGCTGITSITIPASVQRIGSEAFNGWTASQTINIMGHDNRQSTINAGWIDSQYYQEWDYYQSAWDGHCNANIVYRAKQLIIQGISPEQMAEFASSSGFLGLFPAGTTLQYALQIAESFYQTGNAGTAVAGSDFSGAYTNDAFTVAYIPLYGVQGGPWTGSGSYMIFMGVESYYGGQKAYWTGPVNFSSANTTVTFNPNWEVNLP